MTKREYVEYNIANVPEPGVYYNSHPSYNAESLANFSQSNLPNLKIILLGDTGVGKTCLTTRMIYDEFSPTYLATVGASFIKCDFSINGNKSTLQIWDLAGQEEYTNVSMHYCRAAEIALFCFDLTKPETLEDLRKWKEKLLDITVPSTLFLIGCKADLSQEVSEQAILKFAQENQMEYFKTSSSNGLNTRSLMERIGFYALLGADEKKKAIKNKPQVSVSENVSTTQSANQSVNLTEDNQSAAKKKKGCCK